MTTTGWLAIALAGCGFTDDGPIAPESSALSATVEHSGTVARDEWHHFGPLDVADGGSLVAVLAMANGDADLYVAAGRTPTLRDFDCRPYRGGNRTETCELSGPAAIYVSVAGYGWSTDYQLTITTAGGSAPVCGDGMVAGDEACDADTARCIDLDPDTWITGDAPCAGDCSGYDTSACVRHPTCGNGVVEINEVCDQTEKLDCSDLSDKFGGGLATCDHCIGWDETACVLTTCGNATLDDGEVCDGKPIACSALDPAWVWGDAACLPDCSGWDEASCDPTHEQHESDWGTLAAGQWRHYGPFNTAAGAFRAVVGGTDAGGTGDVDLYVRRDRPPTLDAYDCRSNGPESIESCELPGPGLFYVAVYGYATTSDYTVEATYLTDYTIPEVRVNEAAGNVSAAEWAQFGPYFPRVGQVEIILAGTNDADLYVRLGGQPTAASFDCRPYTSGSDETCHFDIAAPGQEIYVGVRGWASSSYFELRSVSIDD